MFSSKQRIVLVSDRHDISFAVWQNLTESRQAAVQVDVLPTLAQTLALLARAPVDAIVLDLNLPDCQGMDTLRRVRAAAGSAPVIVVTTGVGDELRERALELGAEEVYDQRDVASGLVSHSVLYLVDRNRVRLQHARLQVLMDTLPEAVVIADEAGEVRFANPAALTLFGQPEAALLANEVDFGVPLDEPVELLVGQGHDGLRCEMRVVAVEWDGQAARLASIRPLGLDGPAETMAVGDGYPARHGPRAESAARLKRQILSTLSEQISAQMHAVSGLSLGWEEVGPDPLQSCYPAMPRPLPALLLTP